MAKIYVKNTWADEVLVGDPRYDTKTDAGVAIATNIQIVLKTPVAIAGSAVDAAKMNNIETGIDALDTLIASATTPKLDALAAPDDNVNLNASSARHGLSLKVSAVAGQILVSTGTVQAYIDRTLGASLLIGNGIDTITTGIKGAFEIPANCDVESVRLTSLDGTVSTIAVDLWRDTYANFPPTVADSIVSATPPTLTAAVKMENVTLTGWSKSCVKGNFIFANVNSCTAGKLVLLSIIFKATAVA